MSQRRYMGMTAGGWVKRAGVEVLANGEAEVWAMGHKLVMCERRLLVENHETRTTAVLVVSPRAKAEMARLDAECRCMRLMRSL